MGSVFVSLIQLPAASEHLVPVLTLLACEVKGVQEEIPLRAVWLWDLSREGCTKEGTPPRTCVPVTAGWHCIDPKTGRQKGTERSQVQTSLWPLMCFWSRQVSVFLSSPPPPTCLMLFALTSSVHPLRWFKCLEIGDQKYPDVTVDNARVSARASIITLRSKLGAGSLSFPS